MKNEIKINDFELFLEAIKPISKITTAAKISVNENGIKINTRNDVCRCEIKTNSLYSTDEFDILIGDINQFIKIMSSVSTIHNGDYMDMKFYVDGNYLKVESKKLKTKMSMINEDKISNLIDPGFQHDLSQVNTDYEFLTNSDNIKRINNHTFMFSDNNSLRIYLSNQTDMGKNMIYSTLGNEGNAFENSITFEFGMLTSGSVGEDKIILDSKRLNMLNVFQSDEIVVKKPTGKNCLLAFINERGKNGSFINISMVDTLLVK